MKYKQINKLINVTAYLAETNSLIWSDGITLFRNHIEILSPKEDSNCLNIESKEENLFFWFGNGNLWIYNNSKGSLFHKETMMNILAEGFIHCSDYDYDLLVPITYFYNLKTKSLIFDKGLPGEVVIFENSIYQYYNNSIIKYDFTRKEIWKHKLSYLGFLEGRTDQKKNEFKKIIGIAHNNLWVLGKSGSLIAINTETGVLTKTFEWEDEYVDGKRYHPNPTDAFIYEEDNNIYSLGAYFIKINTRTLQIESNNLLVDELHNGDKIKIRSSSVQGQNISFIASFYGTSWVKIIGLFSIAEKKIIWLHELFRKDENKFIPAFNTPQLSGNKLYILDNEKTLYIFEKD